MYTMYIPYFLFSKHQTRFSTRINIVIIMKYTNYLMLWILWYLFFFTCNMNNNYVFVIFVCQVKNWRLNHNQNWSCRAMVSSLLIVTKANMYTTASCKFTKSWKQFKIMIEKKCYTVTWIFGDENSALSTSRTNMDLFELFCLHVCPNIKWKWK